MTRRRTLLLASLIAASVCVGLAVLAMLPPRPGVTKANFDRIEVGMQIEEVECILAGPGFSIDKLITRDEAGSGIILWQHSDGSMVMIWPADKVVAKKKWVPSQETLLNKIRRWLHLPK